jgi:hypothetical protein
MIYCLLVIALRLQEIGKAPPHIHIGRLQGDQSRYGPDFSFGIASLPMRLCETPHQSFIVLGRLCGALNMLRGLRIVPEAIEKVAEPPVRFKIVWVLIKHPLPLLDFSVDVAGGAKCSGELARQLRILPIPLGDPQQIGRSFRKSIEIIEKIAHAAVRDLIVRRQRQDSPPAIDLAAAHARGLIGPREIAQRMLVVGPALQHRIQMSYRFFRKLCGKAELCGLCARLHIELAELSGPAPRSNGAALIAQSLFSQSQASRHPRARSDSPRTK